MNRTVIIGACQAPEVTASPAAALACMLRFAKQAEARRVDLLLFPECYLSGYILQKEYKMCIRDRRWTATPPTTWRRLWP